MSGSILPRVWIGTAMCQIGVEIGAALSIVRRFHSRRILDDETLPDFVRGDAGHVIVEPLVDEAAKRLESLRRGTGRHLLGEESVIGDGSAVIVASKFF